MERSKPKSLFLPNKQWKPQSCTPTGAEMGGRRSLEKPVAYHCKVKEVIMEIRLLRIWWAVLFLGSQEGQSKMCCEISVII